MKPRERLEQWEVASLAPSAAKAVESRGRENPEPLNPVRTSFQRDRDRILHPQKEKDPPIPKVRANTNEEHAEWISYGSE